MKNNVEAQPRKVNKKNHVVEPIRDVDVKHSLLNTSSKPICATCKKSMFDGVHDTCLLNFVENVNSRAKSAKKPKKLNILKPTGHVFTKVVYYCSNYEVTCEDKAKRRNSGTKTKTFEENCYLLPYAVSSKENTAYQRQFITRIRVMINS
ncbi:hypothetical protein Tco_0055402 [Tanacetum coccineum]